MTQAPNGDFRRAVHENLGMGVQQRPVLLVVKKNARILKNLNAWVSEVVERRGDTRTAPLLVIDDEADQASVDTGDQAQISDEEFDPDYDPKPINGEIRKLLAAFPRSAYIAYTATPFANILIHDTRLADGYGEDLFPRSFIVSLQAPSNYVGPATLFGIDTDDPASAPVPLPLCRDVDQTGEGWLAPTHRKEAVPRYGGPAAGPDIRIARGQRPQRALLLIYPLDPGRARMPDLGMPLVGLVISFPESRNARSVTYKYNSVERRLELQ